MLKLALALMIGAVVWLVACEIYRGRVSASDKVSFHFKWIGIVGMLVLGGLGALLFHLYR